MLSKCLSRRSFLARHVLGIKSLPGRLLSTDSTYLEHMYQAWQKDSRSVHPSWDVYFKQINQSSTSSAGLSENQISASFGASVTHSSTTHRILHLIAAYQRNGHLLSNLDPLNISNKPEVAELYPATYGFTDSDLDKPIDIKLISKATSLFHKSSNKGTTTLREVINTLRSTYCGTSGIEYTNISSEEKRDWLRDHYEQPRSPLPKLEKLLILERLAFADRFENFLATKWNTAKRFGLEGLEAAVPGLKALVDEASLLGAEHVVIGMPHRGRLNVLANVVKKPMEMIFKEFAGTNIPEDDDWSVSGDVKYHLGTSFTREYPDGRKVHLSLLANPSHLEAVDPVVIGKARAKMHFNNDPIADKVLPLLLHGDAAFAGQGIVYETMQMSQLKGYYTGGTVHVIFNNQIGFTTDYNEARSTPYASDLGKAFDAPVFHVNADDPEEVCRVFKFAAKYRQKFHSDVIIDIIGYRRYGHNELDQPMFTQPLMYKKIVGHPPVLSLFSSRLEKSGELSKQEIEERLKYVNDTISKAYERSNSYTIPADFWLSSPWDKQQADVFGSKRRILKSGHPDTGFSKGYLEALTSALTSLPDGFQPHPQVRKIIEQKKKSFDTKSDIDWATAEALAFGSLLMDGVHVRISGQDVHRGTFSHRHAVLHDQNTNETYVPLANIKGAKEKFEAHNSLLSEYGVLGFELGVSLENPNQLVLWEAQFGDFANGAQIIIDNFITSGEAKWMRQSGLVMLLPHGYDGQGPEHSSSRIERFLQNADEDPDTVLGLDAEGQIMKSNWQIVNCTTPANYFHALRRQLYRPFRKPLIVASPKNLLRHRLCVSKLEDMLEGHSFHRLLPESQTEKLVDPHKIRRVVICSGKIYYELLEARQAMGVKDVALLRLEQISPFPFDKFAKQMRLYENAELVWVQEEPKNMGAWYFVQDRLMTATRLLNKKEIRPAYVGRRTMASPAEGYGKVHAREQKQIIEMALSSKVHSYGHGRESNHES